MKIESWFGSIIGSQFWLHPHVRWASQWWTADSGEGERWFRRERERHSGTKANSFRSVATLAFRLCRKRSASSRKSYPER